LLSTYITTKFAKHTKKINLKIKTFGVFVFFVLETEESGILGKIF